MVVSSSGDNKQRTLQDAFALLDFGRLRELTSALGLDVADRRRVDAHIDALLCSGGAALSTVLEHLDTNELKMISWALELDSTGRAKAPFIARVLAAAEGGELSLDDENSMVEQKINKQRGQPKEPDQAVAGRSPADTSDAVKAGSTKRLDEAPSSKVDRRPAPMTSSSTIGPGAHVVIRDAVWRVLQVDKDSQGQAVYEVTGVSEVVRDQQAVFLEAYEPSIMALDARETRLVHDASPRHRAGLVYLESLLHDVPPPGDGLCMGHRAAMDVLDFQLAPARLALSQLRPRILIADAVGLGKTLEAGIVLAELMRRGRARRILVVTVKSMLAQFQKELWQRFSIPLVRLDSVGLQRIRAILPAHHNPFYYFDKAIISIDTLKQNNAFRTHLEKADWDVIVIDEAQNAAERGKSRSQRARLASRHLATSSDGLLMLSATPHDGSPESFASLMNMLDPTAIANPREYTKDDIRGLFIRRFKKDVQQEVQASFPERRIHTQRVEATAAEESAFDALARLDLKRLDRRGRGSFLFRTVLEKALFSSPAACLETIRKRLAGIEKRDDSSRFTEDIEQLRALDSALSSIDRASFSRYQALLTLLRGGKGGIGWSPRRKDDRLVIFTERIATMTFLADCLREDLGLTEKQVQTLDGSMPDVEQQRIVEEFGRERSPVRVLLATDVASEGINLHFLCHRLIHFDIPWSLMTFQQRNGRIDRYGQHRRPEIHYLVIEPRSSKIGGDMRYLEILIKKDEEAMKNIGDPSALSGSYEEDEQEQRTAEAIERDEDLDAFEQSLSEVDPFELLLEAASRDPDPSPTAPRDAPSLFHGSLDFLQAAIDHLRADREEHIDARRDEEAKVLEMVPPNDLARRFERLPEESAPRDGRLILTDDVTRMNEAIRAARAEETTWPGIHYAWPLHPVMDWARDRVRGAFERHTAPVLNVRNLPKDRVVLIVSGLIPNRRGQPVIHCWYGAVFDKGDYKELQPFQAILDRTRLGKEPLTNPCRPDVEALQPLVPEAVEKVRERILTDRQTKRAQLERRLQEEEARLDTLRSRHESQLEKAFLDKTSTAAKEKLHLERRRIERVFADFERWVRDALTTEPAPFMQVVAALIGTGKGGHL